MVKYDYSFYYYYYQYDNIHSFLEISDKHYERIYQALLVHVSEGIYFISFGLLGFFQACLKLPSDQVSLFSAIVELRRLAPEIQVMSIIRKPFIKI